MNQLQEPLVRMWNITTLTPCDYKAPLIPFTGVKSLQWFLLVAGNNFIYLSDNCFLDAFKSKVGNVFLRDT